MNISDVAKQSGLSAKAIRYYEDLGLVVPARHAKNRYRIYTQQNIEQLTFLCRARAVGFDLDVCRELLMFYGDKSHRTDYVKALVLEKMQDLKRQSEALDALRNTLASMVSECEGNISISSADTRKLLIQPSLIAKPASITFTVLGELDAE